MVRQALLYARLAWAQYVSEDDFRPNAGIAGVWYHMQFHVVLGTELKALPMLGKHSTNWAMISAPEILRI